MSRTLHYILNAAGEPVPCDDLMQWAQWFEHADRQLDGDYVTLPDSGLTVYVSTVFLGIEHDCWRHLLAPVLWETMIFNGDLDGYCRRWCSQAEALQGHREALALVISACVEGDRLPVRSNIKERAR